MVIPWGRRMGETVQLTASDGHRLSAYVSGQGQARGLVVVQEIFGVNRHIRATADRFASEGYAVCAPALFDRAEPGVELGYAQDDMATGREYRMKLTEAKVMADIEAAAKRLGTSRTGIVGFCFGGTVTWWSAARTRLFAAASCWYGGGIAGSRNERANCPVQMHFGAMDHSIPMKDVDAIRAAQPGVEVYVYPGAGHGFGCDDRGSFNQAAYDLAHQRTLDFLARHVGPAGPA